MNSQKPAEPNEPAKPLELPSAREARELTFAKRCVKYTALGVIASLGWGLYAIIVVAKAADTPTKIFFCAATAVFAGFFIGVLWWATGYYHTVAGSYQKQLELEREKKDSGSGEVID